MTLLLCEQVYEIDHPVGQTFTGVLTGLLDAGGRRDVDLDQRIANSVDPNEVETQFVVQVLEPGHDLLLPWRDHSFLCMPPEKKLLR
jgi:hypothetical protein